MCPKYTDKSAKSTHSTVKCVTIIQQHITQHWIKSAALTYQANGFSVSEWCLPLC